MTGGGSNAGELASLLMPSGWTCPLFHIGPVGHFLGVAVVFAAAGLSVHTVIGVVQNVPGQMSSK